MTRPIKELKGFEKNAFKMGETKTITFKIGYDHLDSYDINSQYVVEKGKFKIFIGKDCLTENYIDVWVV